LAHEVEALQISGGRVAILEVIPRGVSAQLHIKEDREGEHREGSMKKAAGRSGVTGSFKS